MSLYISEQLLEDDLCTPSSEKDNPQYLQGVLERLGFIKVAEHSNFVCQIWIHSSGYLAVIGPPSAYSSKTEIKLSFALYKDPQDSFKNTVFRQAYKDSEQKGIRFEVESSTRKELGDMLFSKALQQNNENVSAKNVVLFLKGNEDLENIVPFEDLNATGVYELLKTFFSDLDSSMLPYFKTTVSVSEIKAFQGIYDLFYDEENVENLLKAKASDRAFMVDSHHGLWNCFVQNGGTRWTLKEREEISAFSMQLNKRLSENLMPTLHEQDLSAKVGGVALREWYVMESLNTKHLKDECCLFRFLCEEMSNNDWQEVMKKKNNWLMSSIHLSPTPWMIVNKISSYEIPLNSFLTLLKENSLTRNDGVWENENLNSEGALLLLLTSMNLSPRHSEHKQWLATPGELEEFKSLVELYQVLEESGIFNINTPIICHPKTRGAVFHSLDAESIEKKMGYLIENKIWDEQSVSRMASMLLNPSGYRLQDFKPLFDVLDRHWSSFPLLSFTQNSLLRETLYNNVKVKPTPFSPSLSIPSRF